MCLTQLYCCVVIPKLVDLNGWWDVLPAGIHDATMEEIRQSFATNAVRVIMYDGFAHGAEALAQAGCRTIYLNGSFVTGKPNPGDYDACWDPLGVDPSKLDPVLLDFSDSRKKQKAKFRGEFFPSSASADGHHTFVEFFQVDKYTGNPKGILRITLSERNAS